ncbi:MAG: CoA-transferase subunit beta [Tepidanaerobacteraceae bacterium]|jgi:acyl CoA:acetate/3-ketoacid CoA transferase beta subunit
MSDLNFSKGEIMAAAGAREIKDGQNVVVGIGLPQISALLAQYTHAPNLCMINEQGIIDPLPIDPSVGMADPRMWYKATHFTSFIGTLGSVLHRGKVDIGFLGALEMDMYGNINSTLVTKTDGSFRHFTGSGGGSDIASLAKNIMVIMRHEKRKLQATVQYNTSPGYIAEGNLRESIGLKGGGPNRVITDKAVLGFDKSSGRMKLLSVHPGVELNDVLDNTGFELLRDEHVPETNPPTDEELRLLREVIDPIGIYI